MPWSVRDKVGATAELSAVEGKARTLEWENEFCCKRRSFRGMVTRSGREMEEIFKPHLWCERNEEKKKKGDEGDKAFFVKGAKIDEMVKQGLKEKEMLHESKS